MKRILRNPILNPLSVLTKTGWIVLFAVVAVVLTAGTHSRGRFEVKPGVERWGVKTGAVAKLEAARFVSLDNLMRLPDLVGVAKNDRRYQNALIPFGFDDRDDGQCCSLHEGSTVRTEGYLRLAALEPDGDYHVQISRSATEKQVLIVEVPMPGYAPVISVQAARTRRALERLVSNRQPTPNGIVLQKPVLVCVEGMLFYDDAHVGDPPRGKRGMKASTLWELHPLTGLRRGHC